MKVTQAWISEDPLDADGLLTTKECGLVDSWIRPRVYGTGSGLAPAMAFKQLVGKSLSGLKRRYNSFPDVKTAEVVWGWAALEEGLEAHLSRRGCGRRVARPCSGRWQMDCPIS